MKKMAFNKDKWIISAIVARYIIIGRDGSVARCKAATEPGATINASDYLPVKIHTHKRTGRVYFQMTWRGIKKSVLLNRAVALRYLPNPNNLPQVNHIDGNKANNAVSNLEWSSGSDNEKHAQRTGLKTGRGSQNSNAKLTTKDVEEIRASQESVGDLAAKYKVGRSTIVNIQKRQTWKHV